MITTHVDKNIFMAKAIGVVTDKDYIQVLVPSYEKYLKEVKNNRRFLLELDEDFKYYNHRALIEDAKLAIRHFKDFGKIAVLSDIGITRGFAHFVKAFFPNRVKVFLTRETKDVTEWLEQD